jgi:hypothetical protein
MVFLGQLRSSGRGVDGKPACKRLQVQNIADALISRLRNKTSFFL